MKVFMTLIALAFSILFCFPSCAFVLPRQSSRNLLRLKAEEWQSGAGGKMEQIEITIHGNGLIETRVVGTKGEECLKVTEGFIERLKASGAEVVRQEMTEEFYEKEEKVYENNNVYEQNNSEW
ncbi:unnamed protein product [Heterosigma akashiwo]|mmetsp:Transcript_52046/g.76160  ORF Transcript_52046/g.76160 Transcript_52046/m.76160 type:complete len:123 (+) Transcript_52046:35-403(+)|eukprot:CAMPEP_0194588368 /NCGR_PEP_ID=MMETSP0292-20121207/19725_1 /TAXON_ID=39354 /ORGANISM="Heterosigma akashiwo, Strain CCMP2393" /LENGTH=122 /DNA_ID=CAMNT_0039444831 /DNA_START=47 /DNA_END=412 /DNA_ORIENTATION=+